MKIQLTARDAKKWKAVAEVWVKKQKSFWSRNVHGYHDEKAFPMPLTPGQRKRFKQTRVSGHLRLAEEGTHQGFTKPREKHSFVGMPSVLISAVVAKDRVIMWHVNQKWNGATAAALYQGPMLKALRRTWGLKKRYTIVEDGDRKGNQESVFCLRSPPLNRGDRELIGFLSFGWIVGYIKTMSCKFPPRDQNPPFLQTNSQSFHAALPDTTTCIMSSTSLFHFPKSY